MRVLVFVYIKIDKNIIETGRIFVLVFLYYLLTLVRFCDKNTMWYQAVLIR